MDIIFLGHSSFKIRGKTASVVTDPYDSKMLGIKFPKVDATIVTISHDHADHNQEHFVENVKKVIKGPGEYEIAGISVIGIASFHDDKKGALRGKNTIYIFEVDGIRIVHLGDLGHEIAQETIDEIGGVDILMIPVGGEFTIGPTQAVEIVHAIEPSLIIPMHFQMPGLNPETFSKLLSAQEFIKEIALPVERYQKLSVKKEEITEGEKVVILEKRSS